MRISNTDRFSWTPLAPLVAAGLLGAAGCGASGPPASSFTLGTPHPVMINADVSTPYDAAPSSDGKTIYFTATGSQGAGVYRAAAGGQAAVVFAGPPFVFPCAIAVSSDGTRLFVSDPGAEPSDGVSGGIYEVALPGGAPTLVGGSAGFIAAGLEVASNKLYVAGSTSAGVPGLYTVDARGGSLAPVATGAEFSVPSGIAVKSANEIYVADSGNGTARVLRVSGGAATVFLSGIHLGYPSGLALTPDDRALLVSALDSHGAGDAVLRVNLDTGHVDATSAGIDQFVDPAGLHRASGAPVYAWADSTAHGTGTVLVFGN